MCRVQGSSKKASIVGLHPLPMRMGVAGRWRGSRKTYHISPANKKVCLKVKRKTRSPTRLLVLCPVALFSCFLRSGEDKRITSQLIRSIVSFPAIFSSSSSEQF
jgi:hypothetical protein